MDDKKNREYDFDIPYGTMRLRSSGANQNEDVKAVFIKHGRKQPKITRDTIRRLIVYMMNGKPPDITKS